MLQESLMNGEVGTSVVTVMEYCTGCIKNNENTAAGKFLDFLHDNHFELHRVDVYHKKG